MSDIGYCLSYMHPSSASAVEITLALERDQERHTILAEKDIYSNYCRGSPSEQPIVSRSKQRQGVLGFVKKYILRR